MSSPYQWTEEADALLRTVHRGERTIEAVSKELRITRDQCHYRMKRLGIVASCGPRTPAPPPLPNVGDGWFPIAHGNSGAWCEYAGSPIGIIAARAAVASGRATMAQRRCDGGFDLMFKVLR